ncbi:hypothetical protein BGZ63DRAFT_182645 [Mariannaea sp. PMI_226]|nr:hypothetical protein BGZ63DRAFT_182645 [Mariannaea sp. PMI_226]
MMYVRPIGQRLVEAGRICCDLQKLTYIRKGTDSPPDFVNGPQEAKKRKSDVAHCGKGRRMGRPPRDLTTTHWEVGRDLPDMKSVKHKESGLKPGPQRRLKDEGCSEVRARTLVAAGRFVFETCLASVLRPANESSEMAFERDVTYIRMED